MALWRKHLFLLLARNAANPGHTFALPPKRTIIMGSEIDIELAVLRGGGPTVPTTIEPAEHLLDPYTSRVGVRRTGSCRPGT